MEDAMADALLQARIKKTQHAPLHADKEWYTSEKKMVRASLQAF